MIISTRPCLRLRTNLGPRIAFWGLIWVIFWSLVLGSIFGRGFGALDFVCNCIGAQNGVQKWNPKQGPKYDPNQDPKMQSGAPNLYGDANKVYMIFIQRSAGRSDSVVQQTNSFNQRRKGNTWAGKIDQTESMNTFADQTYSRHVLLAEDTQSSLTHGKINSMLATVYPEIPHLKDPEPDFATGALFSSSGH